MCSGPQLKKRTNERRTNVIHSWTLWAFVFVLLHFSLCFFNALLFNQNIFRFHCYALHMNMHIERNKAWNMECCLLRSQLDLGCAKLYIENDFLWKRTKSEKNKEKKVTKNYCFMERKMVAFYFALKNVLLQKKIVHIILSFKFLDWIPYKFGSNALLFNRFFFLCIWMFSYRNGFGTLNEQNENWMP